MLSKARGNAYGDILISNDPVIDNPSRHPVSAHTPPAHAPARLPEDEGDPRHIVDILIEERCQSMLRHPLWPLFKMVLYPTLRHREAVRMADTITPMTGRAAFDHLSATLNLNLSIDGLDHVPKTGRLIVVSTHPTGIADGIAMYDALKNHRPDMAIYANRDAIRAVPCLEELIIPVEWLKEKRTRQRSRETLIATRTAFDEGRCLVIFPSGRLAYMDDQKQLVEQDWMVSAVSLARKFKCDIVPVNMRARNSWLYYWFRNLGTELRDITLFNELLNKRNKPFHLTFGPRISYDSLSGNVEDVTIALRQHAVTEVPIGKAWANPVSVES